MLPHHHEAMALRAARNAAVDGEYGCGYEGHALAQAIIAYDAVSWLHWLAAHGGCRSGVLWPKHRGGKVGAWSNLRDLKKAADKLRGMRT